MNVLLLGGTPQKAARTNDMVLPEDFIHGLGAHTVSEGCAFTHILLYLVVEEVHGDNLNARGASLAKH